MLNRDEIRQDNLFCALSTRAIISLDFTSARRIGSTTEVRDHGSAYNIIHSDGHILEPLTLWQDYLDPGFRDRSPMLVIDTDGKERLLVEEQASEASR